MFTQEKKKKKSVRKYSIWSSLAQSEQLHVPDPSQPPRTSLYQTNQSLFQVRKTHPNFQNFQEGVRFFVPRSWCRRIGVRTYISNFKPYKDQIETLQTDIFVFQNTPLPAKVVDGGKQKLQPIIIYPRVHNASHNMLRFGKQARTRFISDWWKILDYSTPLGAHKSLTEFHPARINHKRSPHPEGYIHANDLSTTLSRGEWSTYIIAYYCQKKN